MTTEARSSTDIIINKLNDAVYEFYKPKKGYVELDIVFFHGFHHDEPYWQTWMLADNSACWLNSWLAEEFPKSRIISVSYDSRPDFSDSKVPMDMYQVGENLAQSIVWLAEVGQRCPVVFVGHCVGGLVLKEVCLRADRLAANDDRPGLNPYKTFLRSMKGAFFFSTPSSGSLVLGGGLKQRVPLMQYVQLLSKETARLTSEFAGLRRKHGWKTSGVSEANKTSTAPGGSTLAQICQYMLGTPASSLVVEEASARQDLDDFCVLLEEDYQTICKPKSRTSNNFLLLVDFVRGILETEEAARRQWLSDLHFPRVFVSMPARVKLVIGELKLGEAEPSRVSLVGMGGIGKTTLAKEVLVQIGPEFKYTCFIKDVAKKLAHNELHTLVANNLYSGSGRKVYVQDGDAQSLWLLLRGALVLMILDNVDSEELIGPLLTPDWCGRGSRLIVTSRLRSRPLLPTFVICEVPFLTLGEARELFHAHLEDEVLREIPEDLIERVIKKCDGLPLTVEMFGSYLRFEKNVNIWAGALEKLSRAESVNGSENDKLWAKLKVSFDDLAPLERGMFLDLTVLDDCDSHREQYDLPVWKAVWKSGSFGSSMYIGLRNLEERSFITAKKETKYERTNTLQTILIVVLIHEQLRDMGKSISRPSDEQRIELCRGLWQRGDVEQLLTKYKGADAKTEVLSVALEQTSDFQKQFRWRSFAQLQELRLLRMSNVSLVGSSAQRFPSKLTFLHMTGCSRGLGKRLRFLESDCWPLREDDVEGLHYLTVLLLEDCIPACFPNNFHRLRRLTVLVIRGSHLKKLPREFGLGLVRMGVNISTPLCGLERLKLEDLHGLSELPQTFGLLGSLGYLGIINCSALVELPESLGKLPNLHELEIRHCRRFDHLPNSLGDLSGLESLTLHELSISSMPDSMGTLEKLARMTLRNLHNLRLLPGTVGYLNALATFLLADCEKFERLPDSLTQLKELCSVDIIGCTSLEIVATSFGKGAGGSPFRKISRSEDLKEARDTRRSRKFRATKPPQHTRGLGSATSTRHKN